MRGQDDEHIPHYGDEVHGEEGGKEGFLQLRVGRDAQEDKARGSAAVVLCLHACDFLDRVWRSSGRDVRGNSSR